MGIDELTSCVPVVEWEKLRPVEKFIFNVESSDISVIAEIDVSSVDDIAILVNVDISMPSPVSSFQAPRGTLVFHPLVAPNDKAHDTFPSSSIWQLVASISVV
jgi:hypothetical protein